MKTLLLGLFLSLSAFATDCKVDGISDSPQGFKCKIRQGLSMEKLSLLCLEGTYQIVWKGKALPVSVAYHEEVESGSNPLVFVADGLTLVTVAHKMHTSGSLNLDGKELKGLCFKN